MAVVGKGGSGKSVIAATLARCLADRARKVLVLDSDLLPGVSLSLGLGADPEVPPLAEAAEKDENGRWRLKKGVGAVRAVQRYSTIGPGGIRLLQTGKTPPAGLEPILGSVNAFYQVIHRIPRAKAFADWAIVGDLPAGPRQLAFDWAPYARTVVVVVQPTVQSALAARRIARIARLRPGVEAVIIGNRIAGAADLRHVERMLGERVHAAIPPDEAVAEAERLGVAPIDHAPDSPAISAIERLATTLGRE